MSIHRRPVSVGATVASILAGSSLALLATAPVYSQDTLEQVVVTGTRVADRSITDTAVPVDVITTEALQNIGIAEINQALSVALPSFTFPRPGLADGTDTVRPATLRGLAPDQTLVLVNSKRRHAAALVNVNGTVGRGSSAVDLNTIPTAAIRSLEVLRDGASAQYGSDAIAGVINVRLRDAREGGNLTLSYGQRDTSFTVPVNTTFDVPANPTWAVPSSVTRSRSDGKTTTVSGWKGLSLGDSGFLTLSLEYKDQERTERAGYDARRQYPFLPGNALDPREATIDRFNAWYGEPEVKQLTAFANAGVDLSNNVTLYGWTSYQGREAVSAGFWRRPTQTSQIDLAIYPDGFLPQIAPDVTDLSVAGGAAWAWGDWQMDTSVVWGRNKMEFTIQNTLNASLGPTSKTRFDAGGFAYEQLVFNFSGVREFNVGGLSSPLNVAAGLEARREEYSVFAGEPDSWRNANPAKASGSQVFPGFRPSDAGKNDREAIGAYVDIEANLTDKLLGSVAARFEDYSDFGSSASGKLALRYDFTDTFALRGSVQNGFRAPSLQQQSFSSTATNFIGNPAVPFEIRTFPVSDPAARALGAQDLDAEESVNLSLGTVVRMGAVTLTVDAYRIKIDDRIVLSENLTAVNVRQFLESRGFVGVSGGRFFINGVDTTTEGVDVVLSWPLLTDNAGRFDFTVTGNWNDTKITRLPATNALSSLNPAPALFARVNQLTFEKGTPENKFSANVNWSRGPIAATARAVRYGEVLAPGTTAAADVFLTAKTLFDLEARFNVTDKITAALGADNLFDEYPNPTPGSQNSSGATTFSNYSPFGRSGRFVYGRVSVNF